MFANLYTPKFNKNNFIFGVAIPIIAMLVCFWMFGLTTPKVNNLVIATGNKTIQTNKPFFQSVIPQRADVLVDFETQYSNSTQKFLKFGLTGCLKFLEINGIQQDTLSIHGKTKVVEVDQFTKKPICDNQGFFVLDMAKFTKPNELIKVQMLMDHGVGDLGIIWHSYEFDYIFLMIFGVLNASILILLLYVTRVLQLGKYIGLIIFGGVIIRQFYLSKTEMWLRSYDLTGFGDTGHLGFITFVQNNLSLPDPATGWQFHQAPLYYVISAIVVKVSDFFGILNSILVLQSFNLVIFVVFVIIGVLTIREMITIKNTDSIDNSKDPENAKDLNFFLCVSTALLCFIPGMIIHSTRITNDVLFYLFGGLFLLNITKYYKSELLLSRDLMLSALFASLGLATKVNSLILVFILIIVFEFKVLISRSYLLSILTKKALSSIIIIVVIIGIGFTAGFYKKIEAKIKDPKKDWLVTSESGLSSKLSVDNHLGSFVNVDVQSLLTVPFLSTDEDKGGRQSFFIFLIKSAISGEFSYKNQANNALISLNALVLILILFVAYFVVSSDKTWFKKNWFVLFCFGVFVAGLTFYKVKTPYSCNQDFRFILPSIIPFLAITYLVSQKLNQRKYPVLYYTFWLALLLTIPVSILFIFNV